MVEKITGKQAETPVRKTPTSLLLKPYEVLTEDGEILERLPEYTTMSLKDGGIAGNWYKQWKGDVYPSDTVVVRGREMKPPKFYDRLLELEDPEARAAIRERRMKAAAEHASDSTTRRLADREKVKLAQISQLKRTTE